MNLTICKDVHDMARQAADKAARQMRQAIAERGQAVIVTATGASQMEVVAALAAHKDIDWPSVIAFHLDEYIGLPRTHPASFYRYLNERLVDRVPIGQFNFLDSQSNPESECRRVGELISRHVVDVAFIGIGENGHLAFNDPPADFETDEPFIIVDLDEACRKQQFGEGWFPSLDDVPRRAMTMSIRQILKARMLICSVPDKRKAAAAQAALEGPVTPRVPASILQRHDRTFFFFDPAGASLLGPAAKQASCCKG